MAMTRTIDLQKHRVHIVVYERGWGSKVIDILHFDSEDEAKTHVNIVNARHNLVYVPNYYTYATYVGRVQ